MEKKLKVTGIGATNLRGIKSINVKIDRDHIEIIGGNGAGKTTVQKIINDCFEGIVANKKMGTERFHCIGKHGTAADAQITLQDDEKSITVIVSNHITEKGNDIKIVASDGTQLSKQWLKDFFNAAFLSAEAFISHTPKEQALLLDIDPSEFDEKIAAIKEIAKEIRSKIKLIGEPEMLNEVKKVDVHALYAEKDRIAAHNQEQDERSRGRESSTEYIKDHLEKLEKLNKEVQEVHDLIQGMQEHMKSIPDIEPTLSLDDVNAKINTADETNRAAEAYEANEKKRTDKQAAEKELQKTQDDIKKIDVKRTEYIAKADLPVDGLSVCPEGGLLQDGKRLSALSTGEQIIAVTKLLASKNPQFKTVMVDNFETLDPTNQKAIAEFVIGEGFNLISFRVGEEAKNDGSILLKDCAIA